MVERDANAPGRRSSTEHLYNNGQEIQLRQFDETTREAASSSGATREANAIEVRGASFAWTDDNRPSLSDIDLSIPRGSLAMLVGPVASGKTTLLKGLLGEAQTVAGHVVLLPLRLSWCEQTPWLLVSNTLFYARMRLSRSTDQFYRQNDTIKKNIICFSDFDEDLYRRVIHACDLEKDLTQLTNGDDTIVGSKGLALSGGQKQRIVRRKLLEHLSLLYCC